MSQFVEGSKLDTSQQGFRAVFFEALGQSKAEALLKQLAIDVKSTNKEEVYRWLGAVPAFAEWTADRKISKLRADGYTVANKKWANGVEIDMDDIDDDNLGIVKPRIQQLAGAYDRHVISLLRDLLNNARVTTGPGGAGYDGVALISASHQDGSGPTQSNLLTTALDDTAPADNWDTAVKMLEELTDEEGEYLNLSVTHLVCGSDLRPVAERLLSNETLSGGGKNRNYGQAIPLIIPGITAGHWFAADLSVPGMRPFVYQKRRDVKTAMLDKPTDANVFMRDAAWFGADCRDNAGYAFWQTIVGSNGTT